MKWSCRPNWHMLIILMPKIKLVSFNLVLRVLKHICTGIYTHILESDFCFTAFVVLIRIQWCQKPYIWNWLSLLMIIFISMIMNLMHVLNFILLRIICKYLIMWTLKIHISNLLLQNFYLSIVIICYILFTWESFSLTVWTYIMC
jgi:hypothetical protein